MRFVNTWSKSREPILRRRRREAQANRLAAAARHLEHVVRCGLGPLVRRIHCVALTGDDMAVERILHIRRWIRLSPEPLSVALVLGEQQLGRSVAHQRVGAELVVRRVDPARAGLAQRRLPLVAAPRPRIAEPERGQHAQPRGLRSPVVHGDAHQHVFRPGLRVLHEHVEVPVVVKHVGIEKLVLEFLPRQTAVGLHEFAIRKFPLRILIEIFHVRVSGRAVEVEVVPP